MAQITGINQQRKHMNPVCVHRLFALAVFVCVCSTALATPQIPDTLVFDSHVFGIWQLPLQDVILDKIKKNPGVVLLRSNTTSNHRGYVAEWEVSHGYLWLNEFKGSRDGKDVNIREILDRGPLPIKATWFTGIIHVGLGDYEDDNTVPVVVRFHIEKGKVTDITAHEDSRVEVSIDGRGGSVEKE